MPDKKNIQKNNKNIFLLGLTSLFNDASSEMIMPILPMFITSLGGSPVIIGLIGGLRKSIEKVLTVFAGHWSDKLGRRKIFISSGYYISSLCKLFLAFSKTWPQALIFSGMERTGKGLRTASRDALIAEAGPYKKGLSFGIHRAFDTSGAIIGTLLAFISIWFFNLDFQTIIIIASVIGITSLVPLASVTQRRVEPTKQSLQLTFVKLPGKLKRFLVVSGLFALAHFSYMFFLMRVQTFFTGKLSLALPVLLYLIFNIIYAIGAIPLGILADRIGRRKVIICGYFLFSLTSFGFLYAHTLSAFIVLFMLYGIVNAIVEGNQRAFIADIATKSEKATSLGMFHTTIGILTLVANLTAGALWQYLSPEITFIYGGVLSLLAVLLFAIFKIQK